MDQEAQGQDRSGGGDLHEEHGGPPLDIGAGRSDLHRTRKV
jgi:hypothetical protein